MHKLRSLFDAAGSAQSYLGDYVKNAAALLSRVDPAAMARVAQAIEDCGAAGRTIYPFGNGGSSIVASHFVNDMGVNSWVAGARGFRVCCLADNVASMTAVANDVGFEEIFRRQLQSMMVPGDLVLALSVSGNSPNVLAAIEYAKGAGGVTVGLCGFDGGRLAGLVDHAILVPTSADEYGPAEDAFSIVLHAISSYITMRRGRQLHH